MEKTKLWKVDKTEQLIEIETIPLNLEERIHKWIENDISIILPNAILIGSKVKTDYGSGELDLLAIDEDGDLIIIELKRGLTPRDVTSQALDYASWADSLTEDNINDILQKRGIEKSIIELMSEKFGNSEEVDINENQKIYIVASSIDSTTERICKYLSNNGLQINVMTFNYYKIDDNEFIARNSLIRETIPQKDNTRKRNGRYVTKLFQEDKLKIGQKVKYLPLEDKKGITETATIYRNGSKCLKLDSTNEEYSFSGLRKFLIQKHNLDLNPHFPFWQWTEWLNINDNVKLSDL